MPFSPDTSDISDDEEGPVDGSSAVPLPPPSVYGAPGRVPPLFPQTLQYGGAAPALPTVHLQQHPPLSFPPGPPAPLQEPAPRPAAAEEAKEQQEREQASTRTAASKRKAEAAARFTEEESLVLVNTIRDVLPIGSDEWDTVTSLWNGNPAFPHRSTVALRRKYNALRRKKAPTGDPNVPEDVLIAKDAARQIEAKGHVEAFTGLGESPSVRDRLNIPPLPNQQQQQGSASAAASVSTSGGATGGSAVDGAGGAVAAGVTPGSSNGSYHTPVATNGSTRITSRRTKAQADQEKVSSLSVVLEQARLAEERAEKRREEIRREEAEYRRAEDRRRERADRDREMRHAEMMAQQNQMMMALMARVFSGDQLTPSFSNTMAAVRPSETAKDTNDTADDTNYNEDD